MPRRLTDRSPTHVVPSRCVRHVDETRALTAQSAALTPVFGQASPPHAAGAHGGNSASCRPAAGGARRPEGRARPTLPDVPRRGRHHRKRGAGDFRLCASPERRRARDPAPRRDKMAGLPRRIIKVPTRRAPRGRGCAGPRPVLAAGRAGPAPLPVRGTRGRAGQGRSRASLIPRLARSRRRARPPGG